MATRGVEDDGVRWSAVVLVVIGFAISRLAVASSVSMNDPLGEFVLTSGIPMVFSFALVIFGLLLAVSSVDRSSVRTISRWCVFGTAAMTLATVVSALDTNAMDAPGSVLVGSTGTFAVNTVLGGAAGGTLIGIYAARAARRNRRISAQADRLHLLNRLLRDEVLNATTVVLAHADFLGERRDSEDVNPGDHAGPITRNAEHIQDVIDDVGELTDETAPENRVFESVAVAPLLDSCVEMLQDTHDDARIDISGATDATVAADDQLGLLFDQLLSNAIEHAAVEEPEVDVEIEESAQTVSVTIADDGPGLGEQERALLEAGDLSRYDRPSEGFGLWIVRILLDRYDGSAAVAVDDGTAVTVSLPRADTDRHEQSGTFGIPPNRLVAASIAGLLSGVAMGATLQAFTNIIPVIGALYGTQSAGVGWITHLFHSVTFAIAFATVLSHPRMQRFSRRLWMTAGLSMVFGTALWLVAAGVVMPLWLRVVGVIRPIPLLRPVSLVGHLLWGGLVGGLYWYLQRFEFVSGDIGSAERHGP